MPDDLQCDKTNETAADFIQQEIVRTKNNLHWAINTLGHSAMKAANPVPWFKRYPLKSSIVTAAALAGGAACIVHAVRKKSETRRDQAVPVNVYIKKPKSQSRGWGQLGTALLGALSSRLTEGIRATIINSFADNDATRRKQSEFVPNPKLRDVEI